MKQDVIIAVATMKIAITCLLALNLVVHSGCVHSPFAGKAQKKNTAEHVQQLKIFRDGSKYGYQTKSGEVIIPATFDDARDFSGGLARVNIGATRRVAGPMGGKWGYIDEHGVAVIPIVFLFARDFSHGLAHVVTYNWESGYIDTTGRTVIKLARHTSGGDFSEGLAAVSRSEDSGTNRTYLTDYIDTQGKVLFTLPASGKEFHEGLAAAGVQNPEVPSGNDGSHLYGFIDRKGDWVIQPTYARVGEFSCGLAPVCVKPETGWNDDARWGYLDISGKLVIEAQFNEARPFYKGFALVHAGGQYVTMLDGPSEWRGGKWMVIDRQGKVHQTSKEWIDVRAFAEKADKKS